MATQQASAQVTRFPAEEPWRCILDCSVTDGGAKKKGGLQACPSQIMPTVTRTPHRPPTGSSLQAVIHLVFDRMRGHAKTRDLFHLERCVGVEHVIGEDAAAR